MHLKNLESLEKESWRVKHKTLEREKIPTGHLVNADYYCLSTGVEEYSESIQCLEKVVKFAA